MSKRKYEDLFDVAQKRIKELVCELSDPTIDDGRFSMLREQFLFMSEQARIFGQFIEPLSVAPVAPPVAPVPPLDPVVDPVAPVAPVVDPVVDPVIPAAAEELYPCHLCTKVFRGRKWLLTRHLASHTPDVYSHKCTICDKSFWDASRLNRHMSSHESLRSFLCTHCGKSYKRKETLQTHMKQKHSILGNESNTAEVAEAVLSLALARDLRQ
jgi:hypothetical protein